LAEKLNSRVPGSSPKKTIFLISGAEAVKKAIIIARRYTGRLVDFAKMGGSLCVHAVSVHTNKEFKRLWLQTNRPSLK